MKCEKGFEEKDGKCIRKKEIIQNYCDTNILLAFSNRGRLKRTLGDRGMNKFGEHINSNQNEKTENRLRRLNKCVIDRTALLNDISYHKASAGAVLTATNLRKIRVRNINGLNEGKKAYNNACAKVDEETHFHNQFCDRNKIKENLTENNLEDVRHFGSAIKFNSKKFLTSNVKDFKPLESVTNIKVEEA